LLMYAESSQHTRLGGETSACKPSSFGHSARKKKLVIAADKFLM
jgi:hypothetical protein